MKNLHLAASILIAIGVIGLFLLPKHTFAHGEIDTQNQLKYADSLFAKPKDVPAFPIQLPNLSNRFSDPDTLITDIFNFIVELLTLIVGIAAFIVALLGGLKYLTAGADESRASSGKQMIASGIIGVLIASLSYILIQYIIEQVKNSVG